MGRVRRKYGKEYPVLVTILDKIHSKMGSMPIKDE
jgi:hypothetical protein